MVWSGGRNHESIGKGKDNVRQDTIHIEYIIAGGPAIYQTDLHNPTIKIPILLTAIMVLSDTQQTKTSFNHGCL